MVWAKFPIAAGVMTCAACVTMAAAVPAMTPAARSIEAGVDLKVETFIDFLNQPAFNAIPIYQAAQIAPELLFTLASLDGVPALLNYALTGNTDAFVPADDGSGGYAALSGLSSYRDFNNSGNIEDLAGIDNFSAIPTYQAFAASGDINDLADIDAFSAIPALQRLQAGDRTALYDLDSTSGVQSFDRFSTRGFDAFVPSDDDPTTDDVDESNVGYAALSGVSSLQAYFNSNGSDMSLLNGIDAFSAIKPVPVTPPPTDPGTGPDDLTGNTFKSNARVATLASPVETQAIVDAPVDAPADPPADDSAPAAKPVAKKKTGSYSGSFSPVGAPVLFGSGGGKNAADNGMRGYSGVANGLRKALGMGPDKSSPSAGGGDSAGGGEG